MSGSAALEYGFPSTHSTNAVSVAVYGVLCLHTTEVNMSPTVKTGLEVLAYFYASSIIFGRVYCGMHGVFDIIIGSLLGAILSFIEFFLVEPNDAYLAKGPFSTITIIILIILVLIRIHPEPADDCPCFDDSVAFAGVICGVEYGNWYYAHTSYSWDYPTPSTVPFDLEDLGWSKVILRICIGVLCIFVWKEITKPTMLKILPPVFRVIDRLGLILPRKYFKSAT
jgi:dihydrosphingosine 1-phosphate phosphatase